MERKKFSFSLFNVMIFISGLLLISFFMAVVIINKQVKTLEKDTISYYSLLIKETLEKNLEYSTKAENNEDRLLYYKTKLIEEELSGIEIEDIDLKILDEIKDKYNLDGLAIVTNSNTHTKIEASTTEGEIGLTTEDWGYWNDALLELFNKTRVESTEKGFSRDNFWVGPKTYSYADSSGVTNKNLYKYAYLYNEKQNYLINTYEKEERYSHDDNIIDSILLNFENNTDFIQSIFVLDFAKFLEYKDNKDKDIKGSDPYVIYGINKYHPIETLDNKFNLTSHIESGKMYPFNSKNEKYDVVFTSISKDIYVVSVINPSFLKESLETTLNLIAFVFIITFLLILYFSKKHKTIADEMISKENKLRIKSESMAYTDELTQIYNRNKFNLDISEVISRRVPSTIFFMDFDGFKSINDNFGHDAGDYTLKEVTRRIVENLSSDMNIYRIGGDEFIIISDHISKEQAENMARSINKIAIKDLNYNDNIYSLLGISIGIVNFPEHGENLIDIIKNADKAMYQCKSMKKNTFKFYEL